MNSWCESCAKKGCCYTMEIRPKCYVATTNTASGTPESYLAKSLRYSQDSHEIAKDEPQRDCDKCKWYDTGLCWSKIDSDDHACHYEPKDEPQTEREDE